MSSTDPTQPTPATGSPEGSTSTSTSTWPGATEAGTTGTVTDGSTTGTTIDGTTTDGTPTEGEPSWVTRHTTLLITVMVAVIVAALAIAGLTYYRSSVEDRNADTEAAFTAMVAGQGAAVETVECDGDTCSAVISGQAYTVLVQEDEDGEQHFGVAAYTGD
ncbi:hypothetical protein [Modestobacter italicus]|uniref:hypothetical protein n=1 Tax=Modestobacter italicus (strain DSM 44449 / CECT 9708 / BC 501) TaxID=2732864 RepID=UPI001C97E513|nr:hypothetical protein [Modestobacter italicus]